MESYEELFSSDVSFQLKCIDLEDLLVTRLEHLTYFTTFFKERNKSIRKEIRRSLYVMGNYSLNFECAVF